MLVLGIETSTPQASVTIGSEQGVVASTIVSRGGHAETFLFSAMEFLLEQVGLSYGSIAGVAVGVGPGLFTSMRVGVTTAKTIAQALAVPIVAVPSLDVVAFEARYSDKLICPALDARRGELFYALYRGVPGGVARESEFMRGAPSRVVAEITSRGEETLLVGGGALLYREELEGAGAVEFGGLLTAFPRSEAVVELALERIAGEDFDDVMEIEPMYMRRSDARINWGKRRSR